MRHMRANGFVLAAIVMAFTAAGCRRAAPGASEETMDPFTSDLAFLRQHSNIVVLSNAGSDARVAVAPEYQGRVMTSTTGGAQAPSFGWIGRAAVGSGQRQPHMNVFGG